MVTVSENAKNKFLAILKNENREGHGMRITAQRGMSPFSVEYGLAFVEPGQEDAADEVIDIGDFKIYIDPESKSMAEGATVDYVSGLNENGFKITNPKVSAPPKATGPVAEKVQQIIDSRINPSVATHGGHISLVDIREDIAYLRFGGGCQGCGMVDVTLKQGVEVMLKESIPELKGVMDVTDHAGGTNPYYQPSK